MEVQSLSEISFETPAFFFFLAVYYSKSDQASLERAGCFSACWVCLYLRLKLSNVAWGFKYLMSFMHPSKKNQK